MYTGINQCCFPQHYGTEQCIEAAARAGFNGIELWMENEYKNSPNINLLSTPDQLREIYQLSLLYDIKLSSLSTNLFWIYSLTDNDIAKREKALKIVRKMIDAAKILHCDTILIVPGAVTEDVAYDTAYERALAGLNEIKSYAEKNEIYVGIENVWNKFLLSPLEMKRFLAEVACDFVRLYFDVGNVISWGFPEQWIKILGNQIVRIHIKDFDCSVGNIRGFKGLFEGSMNYAAVMDALNEKHYNSYLTAEIEYDGGDVAEFITKIKQGLVKIINGDFRHD